MKNSDPKRTTSSYGLFALAAAVYTLGVIAFSVWSFAAQRATLLDHTDRALMDATYATEQILGPDYILSLSNVRKDDFVSDEQYAGLQEKLDRFASACGFDALGAALRSGDKTRNLIAGTRSGGVVLTEELRFREGISPEMSEAVNLLAAEGDGQQVHTLHFEDHGSLRVAIRYFAITPETGYALVVARNIREVNDVMRNEAIRKAAAGLFLLMMAFPLVALYNREQLRTSEKLAELNDRLLGEVGSQKARETELKDAIRDLERFNAVSVGRENRIIELKAEVNSLLLEMNRQKKYNVDQAE